MIFNRFLKKGLIDFEGVKFFSKLAILFVFLMFLRWIIWISFFLGFLWVTWSVYLWIVPYFFGAVVNNVHSVWYNVIHPQYLMFVGAWALMILILRLL